MDITALQSDPSFMSLPFTEKVKAMSAIDPTFARLSPEEQHKGLALVFPPSPAEAVAERKNFPPAERYGDPNASQGLSLGDVAGAAGKGLANLAGIPTSVEDVPGAAKTLLLNALTLGQYGMLRGAKQMASGLAGPSVAYMSGRAPTPEENAAAVPVVGSVAYQASRPAAEVMQGNAPTRQENVEAIQGGTALAGMFALSDPALSAAIERVSTPAGAGMVESGGQTYAKALAKPGSELAPLAESIGPQLAARGKILTNVREGLANAFGGHSPTTLDEITVKKFPTTSSEDMQFKALKTKYPDADIYDDGTHFIVRRIVEPSVDTASTEQQAADLLAANAGRAKPITSMQDLRGPFYAGMIGGELGETFPGGFEQGAKIGTTGAMAVEAPRLISRIVHSPLWRTTSGVVKTALGNAMQAQDFPAVVAIGTRILAGQNLENDQYGHDAALHGLLQDVTQGNEMTDQQINQVLSNYGAVYQNPDGTQVEVPYHVQQQLIGQLSGSK